MKIRGSGVAVILFLMYVLAVWVRLDSVGRPEYPYFKGVSGTNFRYANLITEKGTLPQSDTKAAWPDGYSPLRVRPGGIEYSSGLSFRLAGLFTDYSPREFSKILTVLCFCLTVFVLYSLTYAIWNCQAAAFFAAFLIAFARPVVEVTNGKEFLHVTFALILVSIHILLYLRYRRDFSPFTAVLAGLTAIALLGVWEPAPLYMVIYVVMCFFTPHLAPTYRKRFISLQAGALILSGMLMPHLTAQRYLFSWPFFFVLLTAVYVFLRPTRHKRTLGIIAIAAGTVLLSVVFKAFRTSGLDAVSPVQYGLYRLRFLFGKPADSTVLPDAVRFLWSHVNSHPDAYSVFSFLFPVVFLVPGMAAALRELRRSARSFSCVALILALLGLLVFLIDRRMIVFAALGVFPIAAVSLFSIRKHLLTRGIPMAVAAYLVISQSFHPGSAANVTYALGARLGLEPEKPHGFVWASLGNADRELVRFIVSRTSVSDPFLSSSEMSSLVVAFAGRTSLLVPGVHSTQSMRRTMNLTSAYFRDEESLYDTCRQLGVKHILYSIDFLLDRSKHSPLYMSGMTVAGENSVAFRMHFKPETLVRFTLEYENDNYRLFKVTDAPQPMFLTDHPIVYQLDILERHGDDLDAFYDRVIDLLVTYLTASRAAARGEDDAAVGRFRYCLDQAPRFSKAWIGLGQSLLRLGKLQEANQVFMTVVNYAPDNPQALYFGALTHANLGRREEALGLLDILLSSGGDRDFRQMGRELKTILQSVPPRDRSSDSN
jgi:hypothetical protein